MSLRRFRVGHAALPAIDWREGVEHCLEQIWRPGGSDDDVGFVYFTHTAAEHAEPVIDFLRRKTGIETWFGTTSLGICAAAPDTGGVEYWEQPALVIMVGRFPDDGLRVFPGAGGWPGFIEREGRWLATGAPHLALLHADPEAERLPDQLAQIARELQAFVIGGVAAAPESGRAVQVAGSAREGGVTGVVFAADIPVVSGVTQGCAPIGAMHEVTHVEDGIVVELDGAPALVALKRDVGDILARDLSRVMGYVHAGVAVPGSDAGEYTVRNLMGIDEQQQLLAIGAELQEGDRLCFVRRDPMSADEDLRRMVRDVAERTGGKARGGIYVSCLARGPHQFGPDSAELRIVAEELGDVPLVGFFANGEFARDRIHTYSGVLTVFL